MKQYTIGRETGNLKIPATASSVSRQHATITIDDDGVWILEAMAEHKPIFIRQEDGSLMRVSKKRIFPSSVIVLGSPDASGFSFKAADIDGQVKSDPLRYKEEYRQLRMNLEAIRKDEKAYKQKSQICGWMVKLGGPIALVLSLVLVPIFCGSVDDADTIESVRSVANTQSWATRGLMAVVPLLMSILATVFIGDKEEIKKKRKNLLRCPNPQCNWRLSEDEIEQGKCLRCKSHC